MKDTSQVHLVRVTVQGRLGAREPRVARRGSHSAPCAQKRAVRTRGAWRKSRPNAPRARKMKRKGDTTDAQRYAAGSPVLPATRGQVSRELFPSYNGLPSARKPRSRLVLPWLPRLPPGKKGTAVRFGFASESSPEHPWLCRYAPQAVGG